MLLMKHEITATQIPIMGNIANINNANGGSNPIATAKQPTFAKRFN